MHNPAFLTTVWYGAILGPRGACMRRREFITVIGGAAVAWPLATRAQQSERMRRIGVLMLYPESDPEGQLRATAFRQGLQKLGWQCPDRFPMGLGRRRVDTIRRHTRAATKAGRDAS